MKNKCIFLISARDNLLKQCLTLLDSNYNQHHNHTTLIFYHGNRYNDKGYQDSIKSINTQTEYRFHSIDAKIPDHIQEQDLFWNLGNQYASNFRGRIGYLNANYYLKQSKVLDL